MEKVIFKYIVLLTVVVSGYLMFDFLFVKPQEHRLTCAKLAEVQTQAVEGYYRSCLRSLGQEK